MPVGLDRNSPYGVCLFVCLRVGRGGWVAKKGQQKRYDKPIQIPDNILTYCVCTKRTVRLRGIARTVYFILGCDALQALQAARSARSAKETFQEKPAVNYILMTFFYFWCSAGSAGCKVCNRDFSRETCSELHVDDIFFFWCSAGSAGCKVCKRNFSGETCSEF